MRQTCSVPSLPPDARASPEVISEKWDIIATENLLSNSLKITRIICQLRYNHVIPITKLFAYNPELRVSVNDETMLTVASTTDSVFSGYVWQCAGSSNQLCPSELCDDSM